MDYKSTNGPMKCVFVSRLLHAISYLQTTLYQLSLAHLDHVELLILHLFRAPNVMHRKRLHRNRFQHCRPPKRGKGHRSQARPGQAGGTPGAGQAPAAWEAGRAPAARVVGSGASPTLSSSLSRGEDGRRRSGAGVAPAPARRPRRPGGGSATATAAAPCAAAAVASVG